LSNDLKTYLRTSRGLRGIYSVCSAHPRVIAAAMLQAHDDNTDLLLEATSNQVNQDGGYTGMSPVQFRQFVETIANSLGFDLNRLILGGDHLGPNPWQHLKAENAMQHAAIMVRQYVQAGFTKIHLDASMRCADDPALLADETIAQRAVQLCAAAESVATRGDQEIVYVIGTEVPTPGGADHALSSVAVTTAEAAEQSLQVHHDSFRQARLEGAWERVVALVVQPGVEFGHDRIVDYDSAKAAHLQPFLSRHKNLVLEAHSTDYQLPSAYRELVRDGFAILKVGPALTFALRETLFALAAIERELLPPQDQSDLAARMNEAMLANPAYWQKYYRGSPGEQAVSRMYSYSDRIRYYWNSPQVEVAVARLTANLDRVGIPETLLSQHCPRQYDAIRDGAIGRTADDLLTAGIREVLGAYTLACHRLSSEPVPAMAPKPGPSLFAGMR
jgi:D-tagatose-1,6-bisphosphate aldolase subunit GatZ/KbaZ